MMTSTALVGYILLFLFVGVFFVAFHLLIGRLVRPYKPSPEKQTIYECGEPTIGSAWVQFDLRYYVVALLFVIFDVEVAFFFPWAVVFGQANTLANPGLVATDQPNNPYANQREAFQALVPKPVDAAGQKQWQDISNRLGTEVKATDDPSHRATMLAGINQDRDVRAMRSAAGHLGWIAFVDILVFFGVLLVGFAYLWKRGDLAWVRSTATAVEQAPPTPRPSHELVGAGRT